tara:strand:- start:916 stop:1701 length:786 start_codon:yes stop_codon:yes gene_type:complete
MNNKIKDFNQSSGASPKLTQHDNTGPETFYDYVMRNISELNKDMSKRHDLSTPKDGIILFHREMTPEQAIVRTNQNFVESLTRNKKNKIFEYFVFVPEFGDLLTVPTESEIVIFYQLRKSEANSVNGQLKSNSPNLKILEEEFDTDERAAFIKEVESRLLSNFRFYGVKSNPGSGLRRCKILFHDKNNFQFGKMHEVLSPIGLWSPLESESAAGTGAVFADDSYKQIIKRAKKRLNIKPSAVKQALKNNQAEKLSNSLLQA